MHTFTWESDNEGYTPRVVHFIHNGDFSGEVLISDDGTERGEVQIPIAAILAFAAEYVRSKKISALETIPAEDVLMGRS